MVFYVCMYIYICICMAISFILGKCFILEKRGNEACNDGSDGNLSTHVYISIYGSYVRMYMYVQCLYICCRYMCNIFSVYICILDVCHTREVAAHRPMRHVTNVNALCLKYHWSFTRLNESYHTHRSGRAAPRLEKASWTRAGGRYERGRKPGAARARALPSPSLMAKPSDP